MSRPVRSALAALLGAAALLVAGCAGDAGAGGGPSPAAPTAAPTSTPTAAASRADPSTNAPRARTGPRPLPKERKVSVSSVEIDAITVKTGRLETLRTDGDGVLEAPKNPDRAGWYAGGTVPGETGPAVIAGHVDSTTGPAVFFRLREVHRGDTIKVGLSDGTSTTFVADRVITAPKDGFPTDTVFGPTPDAELRLITCGGPYDRKVGGYVDNTIVFATASS